MLWTNEEGLMSEVHPTGFDWAPLSHVTTDDPLRVLFSACLLGQRVGDKA